MREITQVFTLGVADDDQKLKSRNRSVPLWNDLSKSQSGNTSFIILLLLKWMGEAIRRRGHGEPPKEKK
tara:strand:- start:48 stop:254 length:207 start_codon:yes stop_codon:yes gene_type:complete